MKQIITLDHNGSNARLKYFRSISVDSGYWDNLWKEPSTAVAYSRSEAGILPYFLRTPMKRWVKAEGRVLEAGCGHGAFTVAAHALGYRAEGVDYAPEII